MWLVGLHLHCGMLLEYLNVHKIAVAPLSTPLLPIYLVLLLHFSKIIYFKNIRKQKHYKLSSFDLPFSRKFNPFFNLPVEFEE